MPIKEHILFNLSDDMRLELGHCHNYFEKDNIDIVLKLSGIKNSLIIREGERTIPEKELEKFLGIEVK